MAILYQLLWAYHGYLLPITMTTSYKLSWLSFTDYDGYHLLINHYKLQLVVPIKNNPHTCTSLALRNAIPTTPNHVSLTSAVSLRHLRVPVALAGKG